MKFRLLYFPRTAGLAPRPHEIQTRDIEAPSARAAAQSAAGFERRTGSRVLTVKEVAT